MTPSPTASLPVPFFSQLDPSDGPEGWRQCQTSSIAMALAYLGVRGIADDTDYLAIVRRIGDTTAAETHRRALASLKVPTTFRQNMGVDDAKACLLRRRPVVIGLLHRGPVTRPSGGGHYIILTGFDTRGWLVHDPYGEIYGTDNITAYSDERAKKNIVTIQDALKKVMELRGVYFDWKDKDKRGIGVIAQETLKVIPEVVSYAKDIDQYSVAYGNIVGLLIEAIKEQQKQIDELKKKLGTD